LQQISLPARAKINLAIDVLGVRDDGYHEVAMVMQTLALSDRLRVSGQKELVIETNSKEIPLDESNLVYRAAKLLQEVSGTMLGAYIFIEKNIPVAAGLAGGSTDAAAALIALNQIWQLHYPISYLAALGGKLGSDIPFCLVGGTCLAQGRGENITLLPPLPKLWLVLVNPGFAVPTIQVYKKFDTIKVTKRPDIAKLLAAMEDNDEINILENMVNVLEDSTVSMFPQVKQVEKELLGFGALKTLMCGSGPTVMGIAKNKGHAMTIASRMEGRYPFITVTETI